jgi:hypothetical protein
LKKSADDLEIDSLVATIGTDQNWHRAQVKGFLRDEASLGGFQVDIYFVDFGDSIYTTLDKLFELNECFYELPFQAVECSLDGVKSAHNGQWSDEVICHFENIVFSCKWKKVNLKWVKYVEEVYNDHLVVRKPSVLVYDKENVSSFFSNVQIFFDQLIFIVIYSRKHASTMCSLKKATP